MGWCNWEGQKSQEEEEEGARSLLTRSSKGKGGQKEDRTKDQGEMLAGQDSDWSCPLSSLLRLHHTTTATGSRCS